MEQSSGKRIRLNGLVVVIAIVLSISFIFGIGKRQSVTGEEGLPVLGGSDLVN